MYTYISHISVHMKMRTTVPSHLHIYISFMYIYISFMYIYISHISVHMKMRTTVPSHLHVHLSYMYIYIPVYIHRSHVKRLSSGTHKLNQECCA